LQNQTYDYREVTRVKDKIERLSKGEFEYEQPSICVSVDEIRITIEAGKFYESSFTVSNSAGRPMKGIIYSSNRLLQLKSTSFSEAQNIIFYQCNGINLSAGETVNGRINIVSDCNEISIPFYVTVEAACYTTVLGKIKTLDQFTKLARMDWTEAKKIFRSEDFERVFLKNEEQYQAIYHNLLKSISTSQALEEFLIATDNKAGIHLKVDKSKLTYMVSEEGILDKLTLTKDHWGYAEIRVSTEAPFIQLEQKFLWADRFIGNTHQIPFKIDPKKLKAGNNFGQILIKTTHQTMEVEIICQPRKDTNRDLLVSHEQYRTEYRFIKNYLSLRLNQIDSKKYLEDTKALLDRRNAAEGSKLIELFQLHMAIISGQGKMAEQLLTEFTQKAELIRKSSVLEYCAYLYLDALYKKQDEAINAATEQIRRYYNNGYYDWQILWFLLYTDKRYEKNKQLKLTDMKEQFEFGCHSPILYYEAICIYNEEPYLLRELSKFEIQVLNFGIKHSIVSRDLAGQYTYLANRKKHFYPIIFHGLTKLYEEYQDTEILSTICCMLIKGMKKGNKYFPWFHRGIEAQLRITELYEYYMYSINDQSEETIPQSVLLYFIYNSNLSDRKKAFLYSNIIKNKENNEAIYRSYYKRMEVFAEKMLEAHYINKNLAVLYQEFFRIDKLKQELARLLPFVLYKNGLICSNSNVIGITIYRDELGTEENVPLIEGRAQIDIYSANTQIYLVDSFGNRFVTSMEYTITPYLNSDDYEMQCLEYSDHPMLLLHLLHKNLLPQSMNETSVSLLKKVLTMEGLTEKYATKCRQALIEYYFKEHMDDQLEYYLKYINLKLIQPELRDNYLEYMIERAFYDKAQEALATFGYDRLNINSILKFCSGWLQKVGSDTKNELMVALCYHVFMKGIYDDMILRYLVRFYQGSISDMLLLWKAAKGFELDTAKLEERLLVHMLQTESHLEESHPVFKNYYKNVSNNLLVRAFLSYHAYQYLVHDRKIPADLFKIMKRELNYEENDICLLAWLKYNAGNKHLSGAELTYSELNILRFIKKEIILPFFMEYQKKIRLPERITDKFFVQYKADPGQQIYIHYKLQGQVESEYLCERMPNVYMGIHSKEFVLLYHEVLEYYITIESERGIDRTDVYTLQNDREISETCESKLTQMNRILQAKEIQDENTLFELMEHFVMTEAMITTCFQQI
jgi:hypothetical protein